MAALWCSYLWSAANDAYLYTLELCEECVIVAHQENPYITTASYLSPQDVAQIYNVSYRTVLQWIRTGELEAYQLAGRLYRIPPEALDHLAQPVVRDLSLLPRNKRVLALPVQSTAKARGTRT